MTNTGTQIACNNRAEAIAALEALHERSSSTNLYKDGPLILSDVPKQCIEGEVVLGIDEAGRGPVLGPMTYGACYWSFSDEEECEACNFQDSKQMSREARKILYENMIAKENVGFILRVLHASEISRNMLRKQPYNLNAMSHDAAMQMISSALHANVKVKKVYVDTVGNPDSYCAKLERAFSGKGIEFVVEKKADSKFATCSAASILAKVLRDELTSGWMFSEGNFFKPVEKEYGSGYPSDPRCKVWMEKNLQDKVFCYPDFVRFSWGPAKDAVKDNGVLVEWEADEEEDDDHQQTQIKSFFMDEKNARKRKRTKYFEKHGLSVVEAIAK